MTKIDIFSGFLGADKKTDKGSISGRKTCPD